MITKWKEIKRSVYKHSPFRSIEDVTFELPNGDERVFSLKKEGSVVAIMAMDINEQVILAKQFRPGPNEILDELPGGGIDKNENSLDAAKRELREETGYESDEWIVLGTPKECAYSTITRYAYLVKNCKQTSELDLDETEYIEVVKKPLIEFLDQLIAGDCTDPEVGWMGLYKLGFIKK